MKSFIRVVQDIVLMLTRIGFGLILIAHGWHRWQQVGISAEISYLQDQGVPRPELWAWGATALEIVGGLLMVLGLAVPLVAVTVVVQQIMIIAWLKWPQSIYLTEGGFEYNTALALLGLVFFGFGSGRAGLDALFRRSAADDPHRHAVRDDDLV